MPRTTPAPTIVKSPQHFLNASFSGPAGQLGAGDRGAFGYMPQHTGNPYDSNDYVFRWRQYVHLYETSWEARKIVRIIPEDALRKDWLAEDIPEEMAKVISTQLDRMQFGVVLKRSLILERLLGGCLTFLGLDDSEDDPSKPYHPKQGSALRFCNAIPISRISRMNWDTNPLSEHYMRPSDYTINGQALHTSRCLVWDGEPLFDPYDFALTNFRGNLAGFGPSKLAPIWDDIVKAVGTRQAAYQLIQTNNAILVAVQDLQDLAGTKSGQEALRKVKAIAQQLSAYNAALIDGDKVEVKQHSASFGSVPELILTFIQILSAASDIPATRFLGQAPGGLNATGDSDLENYYNVIDAYQRQRIEPQIRRVYDIVGFHKFGERWKKEREKLTFKFLPLWNLSELEEADRSSKIIDNAMKLLDAGLISEEKVIQEINAKGALSVNLDETDISVVEDIDTGVGLGPAPFGQETPRAAAEQPNAKQEIQRLRNVGYIRNANWAGLLIKDAGGNPDAVDHNQFLKGFVVEQEHADTVGGEDVVVAKIVLDHLAEDAQYYSKLERVENSWEGQPFKWIDRAAAITSASVHARRNPAMSLREVCTSVLGSARFYSGDPNNLSRQGFALFVSDVKKNLALSGDYRNTISLDSLPEPTEAQIHSGNYKKHHLKLHGLDISIENPQGSTRRGTGPDGTPWESVLPAHYGYVKRTEGADGDHVDLYIGPFEKSELVFVVDQNDADTGEFDEHKCIFGALSMTQAKELYLSGFGDGRGQARLRQITPMHVSQFKQWLAEGDTKAPFAQEVR